MFYIEQQGLLPLSDRVFFTMRHMARYAILFHATEHENVVIHAGLCMVRFAISEGVEQKYHVR